MGKIWMKTKYDAGMRIDIPHNINIAAAMFGFRELGAEIIPYHLLDDIYDEIGREDNRQHFRPCRLRELERGL